jgi:class 3 adenylate cyclase
VLTATHLFWVALLAASLPVIGFALAHQRNMIDVLARDERRGKLAGSVVCRGLVLLILPIVAWSAVQHAAEPAIGAFVIETISGSADPASLSLAEVQAMPESAWQVVSPEPLRAFNFSPRERWLKISIPATKSRVDYVASWRFPFVERVDFALVRNGALLAHESFDAAAREAGERSWDVHPTFEFSVPPVTPAQIYARVVSAQHAVTPLHLTTKAAHSRHLVRSRILMAVLLGAFMGCMLFNASLFMTLREKVYRQCIAFQAPILVSLLAYNGLLPVDRVTQLPTALNQALVLLAIPMAMATHSRFMVTAVDLRRDFPWLCRGTEALLPLALVLIVFYPFVPLSVRLAGAVASLVFFTVFAVSGVTAILSREYGFRHVLGSIGLVTGTLLHVLTLMGVLPESLLGDQIPSMGAAWDAVFVSAAISERINSLRSNHSSLLRALSGSDPASPAEMSLAPVEGVEARLRVVIMVIDIANFTLITEKVGSAAVYNALARRMREMRSIINELGGTVDRSLGDGLLCFFAQNAAEDARQVARRALEAARRIQLQSTEAPIDRYQRGLPVAMPLRIGLHTDEVLIGNLGGASRLDFTMMGRGVHFTRQLESAANQFKVMLSSDLRTALGDGAHPARGFNPVHVAIDAGESLTLAYEFDPLVETPELLREAERQIAEFLGYTREARRSVEGGAICLVGPEGRFVVKNLSLHGLGVVSETFVGRKSTLWLRVETGDEQGLEQLRQRLLETIQVEVRWCKEVDGRFEHGLRIVGLNVEQKQELYDCLLASQKRAHASDPMPIAI